VLPQKHGVDSSTVFFGMLKARQQQEYDDAMAEITSIENEVDKLTRWIADAEKLKTSRPASYWDISNNEATADVLKTVLRFMELPTGGGKSKQKQRLQENDVEMSCETWNEYLSDWKEDVKKLADELAALQQRDEEEEDDDCNDSVEQEQGESMLVEGD
jgi:septal ring factor EnvC (AmiA/AmiB activator)